MVVVIFGLALISLLAAGCIWKGAKNEDVAFAFVVVAALLGIIALAMGIFFGVALVSNQENAIEAEISAIEERNESLEEVITSLEGGKGALVYSGFPQYTDSSLLRDEMRIIQSGIERIKFLKIRLTRRTVWLHGFILPW